MTVWRHSCKRKTQYKRYRALGTTVTDEVDDQMEIHHDSQRNAAWHNMIMMMTVNIADDV